MNVRPSLDVSRISDYQQWLANARPTTAKLWNYLHDRSDIGLAAIFAKLFWPDLVEVEGCIILSEHYEPKTFRTWWQRLQGNRQEVERVVNHTHIYDLFSEPASGSDAAEAYEYVAQVLLRCWEGRLRAAFPDLTFEFYYGAEPDEYGPTISFWHTSR